MKNETKEASENVLASRRFSTKTNLEEEAHRFSMDGIPIATPGNLIVVAGQPKAGKSALLGAMLAAIMEGHGDTLKVQSTNPKGQAVIHFDTEQSKRDHANLINIALKRSGKPVPKWLRSYSIADIPLKDRISVLESEINEASSKHKGIHSIFLDGVADLIVSPNGEASANSLVSDIQRIASEHQCVVVCFIHLNPGKTKTRGHLGSQLDRKAETSLVVEKSENVSVVYTAYARHASISRLQGPRFAWNNEQGMHTAWDIFGRKL